MERVFDGSRFFAISIMTGQDTCMRYIGCYFFLNWGNNRVAQYSSCKNTFYRKVTDLNAYTYISTFFEGVIAFLSPCILPLVPVYIFYLAGVSAEENSVEKSKKGRLIVNAAGFVIGFTLLFLLLGAAATSLGRFLGEHRDVLRKVGGIIMVIFGLSFAGVFHLRFSGFTKRLEYRFQSLKFFNSIIFGAVFGVGTTTCTLPMLGSALVLAGNANTLLDGMLLLFIYSVGFGVPFILSALIYESIKSTFHFIQRYWRIISIVSGIVLIIAGVLLYTDRFKYLSF